jgi:SAM-dependent methyltransferase
VRAARIAERLRRRGIENLELLLLELNPALLERALLDATRRGIGDRVTGAQVDLNRWEAPSAADVYFANHSLHHLVALESLFEQVATSLDPRGVLLVNDMIGRNGHVRWPEAAELVKLVWRAAPARYRWNHVEQHVDDVYPDLDCSTSAFEGIRAQDILPLLLARFHPDVYVTFLNVADPFLDRIYGPNFDVENPEDQAFLDAVARLDDATLDMRVVTPTHLVASFRTQPVSCRYPRERSPERTVRRLDAPALEGTPIDHDTADREQQAPSAEVAALRASLEEAWGRYHHLRRRKAVRAALALSALRARLTSRGSRGSRPARP